MWMLTPSELRKSPTGRACSFEVGAVAAVAVPGRSAGTPTSPATSAAETTREARPVKRLAHGPRSEREREECAEIEEFGELAEFDVLAELGDIGHDLAP